MAGVRGLQSALIEGTILAGSWRQAAVTLSTSAVALTATSTPVLWVLINNISTINVFVGSSTVTPTGATRGIRITQNGNSPVLQINDLSQVFVVAESGTPVITYIAGVAPADS